MDQILRATDVSDSDHENLSAVIDALPGDSDLRQFLQQIQTMCAAGVDTRISTQEPTTGDQS